MDNAPFFTDLCHEKWMEIAQELYRHVYAEEAPEVIFDWLMERVGKLRPTTAAGTIMTWPDSFEIYDAEIARRIALAQIPEAERKLFSWPWASWNKVIDPAEGGMLVLLAGPDGAGKTSYAECIAETWARRGQRVVLVHFELSKVIMLDRRAARHTEIARRRLKLANDLSPADLRQLAEARAKLSQWPGAITYLHTPGKTLELVLRELTTLKRAGNCDVVVLDYLEKAQPSAAQLKAFGSNIFAREAADVELIKSWSEQADIDVPVLVLSQFNKAGKHSSAEDLDRTMIRGAGEKTEKANVVILLLPDKKQEGVINVRIDKNTLGPTANFKQFLAAAQFNVADLA